MLEKDTSVKEVDKLMSILLMEAGFNLLNKLIIGVYIIISEYKAGIITLEKYLRIKVNIDIEEVLNKYLFFSLRMMRGWDNGNSGSSKW